MARALWIAVLAAACKPPESPPPPGDDDDDTVTTSETATTGSTGDTATGATGDTGPVQTFDCEGIPEFPTETNQLSGPRGYHDVAFDTTGHLIGSDGNSLLEATYDGTVSVFLPGTDTVQGMDWLPNGDLVYADAVGSIIRVTPQRQRSVLASGTGAYSIYGVRTGPDGMVYVATWRTVERFDPATGQRTQILNDPRVPAYVVDFSPDHHTMYIGTIWGGGGIWELPLDDDLNPTGPPTRLATVGIGPEYLHDALGVDLCGNLYVAEYYTNNLFRVSPTGEVQGFYDYSDTTYGHGLEWGSGIGGWRTDAIYVPQPYNNNQVMEIVIGVPKRE